MVAGGSQLDAELGGDDTAAAIGWIAGNSDLHKWPGYRVQVEGYRVRMQNSGKGRASGIREGNCGDGRAKRRGNQGRQQKTR